MLMTQIALHRLFVQSNASPPGNTWFFLVLFSFYLISGTCQPDKIVTGLSMLNKENY